MKGTFRNLNQEAIKVLKPLVDKKTFKPIIAGQDYITVAGQMIDQMDILSVLEASLDGWFTAGRFSQKLNLNLQNGSEHLTVPCWSIQALLQIY